MIFERHIKLFENFEKIRNASVFVAGAGGLGSTVLTLLVRIGVGTVYFADCAVIDEPDLNRQILYTYLDIGKPKTFVAKQKLEEMSPYTKIHSINAKLDENFQLPDVDLVIDCLDSFQGKFLLDKLCHKYGKPLVHAGVEGFQGQVTVIIPGKTFSLRALFHGAKDENRTRQVFPSTVLVAASLEVCEAVKLICQEKDLLTNKILFFNLKSNSFEVVGI
ncbi:HesA/MoeB/ThiF family protein [Pseudothermotoga thermarum]|uniref:UBA/THIF-type NAD/FAD binding protein n=1 Tax=Pseudothermotoga thermarum DSM 5069 TaxID=688269 RepID=F7YVX1_9THEM|nr:HesA/MoeB/ThiF family protein [Pseudothermotoga thermarum]AEH51793.1 UBA/THIF-type NAD/FAD binding protein [Pseudothermotoga thermarum DSM 5069]